MASFFRLGDPEISLCAENESVIFNLLKTATSRSLIDVLPIVLKSPLNII